MKLVSKTAFNGALLVDATKAKGLLYYVPAEVRRNLKHTQDGYDAVLEELQGSVPEYAALVGLAVDVLQRIQDCTDNIAVLKAVMAEIEKLYEVVAASIALQEDRREAIIASIAELVTSVAERQDPSVAPPFKKTLKYHAQVGEKAAATRRKNAEAKAKALKDKDEAKAVKATAKDAPEEPAEPG